MLKIRVLTFCSHQFFPSLGNSYRWFKIIIIITTAAAAAVADDDDDDNNNNNNNNNNMFGVAAKR